MFVGKACPVPYGACLAAGAGKAVGGAAAAAAAAQKKRGNSSSLKNFPFFHSG
jgi:hypothetical protein